MQKLIVKEPVENLNQEKLYEEQLRLISFPPFWSDSEINANVPHEALIKTKKDLFTFIIDGKYLHSKYDPVTEARRQIENLSIENEDQLLLFFGAGLGYSIECFCRLFKNPCIWFEPDVSILAAALRIFDFRKGIVSGQITVVPVVPHEELLEKIFQGRGNRHTIFTGHKASYAVNNKYFTIQKQCERFLNKKDVNMATLARFDRIWAKNLYNNYLHLINAAPVSLLFNRYKDYRAIICGAGPSLSDTLGIIRNLRRDCLLIAVDTALRVLSAANIDPDIIVAVDPQPQNRVFLEGYNGNAIFVIDPALSYHALRILPANRIFFTSSPFPLGKLFFHHMEMPPGDISFGGSVSTNAYDLAVKMGCSSIFLFGQDLSFPDGQVHARGAVMEERLNYLESRIFRREKHNYNQLTALPVRILPALNGDVVNTNDKLLIFHQWFSKRLQADLKTGIKIYNCSARGALIEGIPHKIPDKTIIENSSNSAPTSVELLNIKEKKSYIDVPGFQESLNVLIADLKTFLLLVNDGEQTALAILNLVKEKKLGDQYKKLLQKINEIDERVKSMKKITQILGSTIQNTIFQLTEEVYNADIEKGSADLRVAQKTHLFYAKLHDACKKHISWSTKTMRVIEKFYFNS